MQRNPEALVQELRSRLKDLAALQDEPDFFHQKETLARFLKARDWSVDEAEKQLLATVAWRRASRPLHVDCTHCHQHPGYHSMRQVGFDCAGRPVIYSCFAQAAVARVTPPDAIAHVTYLLENAARTLASGVTSWVFVFDCTGMTLPSCNPKLGYSVTQVMASHYPERLALAICINHNPVFQGIWNAIKVFLHPNTSAKMRLVRGKKKVRETFDKYFPEELRDWLLEETRLNKQEPLSEQQRLFWEAPRGGGELHDPRGCPSYVSHYVDPLSPTHCTTKKPDGSQSGATFAGSAATVSSGAHLHLPHPNVLDALHGCVQMTPSRANRASAGVQTASCNGAAGATLGSTHSSDSEGEFDVTSELQELEISDEYRIPSDAANIH